MSFAAASQNRHSARNTVTGEISNGVTWEEDIAISDENGNQVTGISSDEFRLTFRAFTDDTATDLSLTTADGGGFVATNTLTINEGASSTLLQIRVPQSTISALIGDFVCDLVSKQASDGRLIHWAHGVVTFRNDPIAF